MTQADFTATLATAGRLFQTLGLKIVAEKQPPKKGK
jgi:hypothetical protein